MFDVVVVVVVVVTLCSPFFQILYVYVYYIGHTYAITIHLHTPAALFRVAFIARASLPYPPNAAHLCVFPLAFAVSHADIYLSSLLVSLYSSSHRYSIHDARWTSEIAFTHSLSRI